MSNCGKNTRSEICECDIPCGAVCVYNDCRNDAEKLVQAETVLGPNALLTNDGVIDVCSSDVWCWVCNKH